MVLAVVVLALGGSARAEGPRCLDAITIDGPDAFVLELRDELARGPLASAPASRCRDVQVVLSTESRGVRFRYRQGAREAGHRARDLPQVRAWLESWIVPLPMPPAPAPAPAPAPDPPPPPPEPPPTAPPLPAMPSASPSPPPSEPSPAPVSAVHLGAGFALDGGSTGLGVGGELLGALRVAPQLALGLSLGAQWSPERDGVQRFAFFAGARAGWVHPFAAPKLAGGALELGVGLGVLAGQVSYASTADTDDDDDDEAGEVRLREDEAGPFASLYARVGVPLAPSLRLDVGARARLLPSPQDREDPDEDQPPAPTVLPRASVMFTVGLAWERGSWR